MKNNNTSGRVWELDFLRGIALILMVLFHLLYDLNEFYGYPVHYNTGVYFYIGKTAGILFIMISAISSAFSRNNFKRAVMFLGVGMLITLITHLYNPAYGIKYGILHLLGTSVLIYPLFKNLDKYILAVVGTVIIALGIYFDSTAVGNNYLFLFNLTDSQWVSADYYPMFPWLGVFFYGVCVQKLIYPDAGKSAAGVRISCVRPTLLSAMQARLDFIAFLGRHTLSVYLAHQPLLILLIGIWLKAAALV
ncbi:heparan-alpha-glucosaminide N-acetyltransferase [Phosphitispora fastidiosa]|uniref:heparan-alpha-glucosaminide N-acetyltransferase n=1 Tax=Phosphitispora fastidiosa TaxID=2837202 RepID=UPI001E2F81A2|nr:putative membrane protein [Phosphitispora fastidiosa]